MKEHAEMTGDGGRSASTATPAPALVEEDTDDDSVDDDTDGAVAFLQKEIRRVSEDPHGETRHRLISLLKEAGKKLNSPVLSTLAVKVRYTTSHTQAVV